MCVYIYIYISNIYLYTSKNLYKYTHMLCIKSTKFKAYCRCLLSNIQCLFARQETTYSMQANHDLEWKTVCSTMQSFNTITAFKLNYRTFLFQKYFAAKM